MLHMDHDSEVVVILFLHTPSFLNSCHCFSTEGVVNKDIAFYLVP